MGADLYIPKLRTPIMPEREKAFDEAVKERDAIMRMPQPDDAGGRDNYGMRQIVAERKQQLDKAQAAVEAAYERLHDVGYFRDSYNNSSVLWRLDLSWWSDLKPDIERRAYDEDDLFVNCSPELCRAFLAKVEAATLKLVPPQGEARFPVDDGGDGENSADAWNKYFTEKREKLIAFLKEAIENGGMYASC